MAAALARKLLCGLLAAFLSLAPAPAAPLWPPANSGGFNQASKQPWPRGAVAPVQSVDHTVTPALQSWEALTATGLATQFDSTGKRTYRPNNLLTYSNTFSNAAWTKTLATVASGVSDPFGGTNAWTLTATGGGAQLYQSVSLASGTTALATVWMRRRTGSGSIGIYQYTGGTYSLPTISPTGSWQQFTVVQTPTTGSGALNIQLNTSGDAVDIYLGALSAVTYETTPRSADQVITTSAAYYGQRFDYTYNGSSWVPAGLLVEGAATNSTYPSIGALSGGNWTLTALYYPSIATGIDGVYSTAAKAALSAGHTATTGYALSTTTSGTGVVSAYAKPAGYNYLVIVRGSYVSGDYAIFDLNAGTVAVAPTFAGSTAVIKQFGSFWFCELRSTQNTTINAFSVSSAANISATANGTDGVYITEFQTELGATAASSRIRTSASAVTRAAETLTFSGYTSNPFAIMSAPESTSSFACNKYADQATANAAVAAANQWIKSVKIWPVGTPLAQQGC